MRWDKIRLFAFGFGAVIASAPRAEAERSAGEPACYASTPFWGRITDEDSKRYCLLVDRARAKLSSDPKEALSLATRASQVTEPALAARLVIAHAHLLLGQPRKAHEVFSGAAPDLTDSEVAAVLTASSVSAGARAALLSGDYASALRRYRWAVLRLHELHRPREEARILIEAAVAAAFAEQGAGREARAYLATATSKNAPLMRPIAQAAWALSLYREGDNVQAKRRAAQFESSWEVVWMFERDAPVVGAPGEAIPVLPAGEQWALAAVVAEAVEPEAADEHWAKFVEEAGDSLPAHLREATRR